MKFNFYKTYTYNHIMTINKTKQCFLTASHCRSLFLTSLEKKILPLLAVLWLCFTPLAHTFAQSVDYEITCAGIGVQGTYLVKVTSYGKTVEKAQHQLKKDAVHGVLFKGLSGSCRQKPIITDASKEEKHATFFATFFKDGGAYLDYISMDAEQLAVPVKVGRQYKVSMVVSVKKDALRKCMEKEGIIRPLGL